MLRLNGGLAQRGGEGLVHFVIREMFSFVRVLGFLGGHGKGGEGLRGLPRSEIDDGFLGCCFGASGAAEGQEGQTRHGVASGPREDDAAGQES